MDKKIIIGLVVAVVASVIILIAMVAKANKQKEQEALNNANNPSPNAGGAAVVPPANNQPVTPTPAKPITGYPIIFGQFSEAAKKLQAKLGVKQDGVIGPLTLTQWKRWQPDITERFKISSPEGLNYFLQNIDKARQTFMNNAWVNL